VSGALAGGWVHPEWAPLVAAGVALVAAVVLVSFARARRRAGRLLGDPGVVGVRRFARDLALVAALAAIAAAALGPRLGTRLERMPGSGVDVVLLVDVSRSMDAADVPPSRLVRARQLAIDLLARLAPGDRAALAAFAGRGVLLTPLTPDHDALAELAGALDGELLVDRASDLGDGVAAALRAFEAASERPRVLVVLSDGEDPAGGDDAAAAALARAGVRLVTIALGSEEGVPVPDRGGWLRDDRGRTVVSRRDAERLARWAALGDGAAFTGDRWGAIDLAAALAAIRRDAAGAPGMAGREAAATGGAEDASAPGVAEDASAAHDEVARRVPAVRTTPLAALAFALLWLEWTGALGAVSRARRRRARQEERPAPRAATRAPARAASTAALALAALTLVLAAPPPGVADEPGVPPELREAAEALGIDPHLLPPDPDPDAVPRLEAALRVRPGDPALLVALGVARAERGDRAGAEHALRAAALGARDPALAGLAWYDLGVLALGARELEAARDAFLESLALAPDDGPARFNLEWTLRALEEEPPPPTPGGRAPQDEEESEPEQAPEPPPGRPEPRDEGPDAERPAPSPESGGEAAPRFAPELADEEVQRWLDEVQDAAGAALRAAADDSEGRQRRRPGAAW
jgi:Mg-chelatase subunit ChlD/tetratricopeptide (TPR) repeat protein